MKNVQDEWIKILRSAIDNNKLLERELEQKAHYFIQTNLDKIKDGNDLEKRVYRQYIKNKKLSGELLKEYSTAILSEIILITESEINIDLLKYVFDKKLDKTLCNEVAIGLSLASCLFSFCSKIIDTHGKDNFMKLFTKVFNWHHKVYEMKQKDPKFVKKMAEGFNVLNDILKEYKTDISDYIPSLSTKKEDLN